MATHTRYAPDRGLTVRMTATMFLLGLVFVAFVALIIGIMTAAHASGAAIILVAVIFGGGSAFISLFYSDKIALAAAGAREVSPQQAPELHGIVDRLCALADMDKPRVAIAPARMPNAFATGRNSKNSVLCVTEGLLYHSGLTQEELEGVLAHELSHVAHKDVQVMTYASLLAIVAGLLVRFAFYSELFGGGRARRQQRPGGAADPADHARLRGRVRDQLPADQAAVPVPGAGRRPQRRAAHPEPERADLRADQGQPGDEPDPDPGPAGRRAAERLLLRPGDEADRGGGGGGGASLSALFSTHPSLEKRIEQLSKIQRELGQVGPDPRGLR